jgi:hypothetical protein
MARRRRTLLSILPLSVLFAGCVEHTMTIKTDPPGALVYLNDEEFGRSPVRRDFTWYGDYEVQVRKEGYDTLKTHQWVKAPWYLWVPFDLFMELQPFTIEDHHELTFKLQPESAAAAEPGQLMSRAEDLRGKLESSQYTRQPTTRSATTKPAATRPAK